MSKFTPGSGEKILVMGQSGRWAVHPRVFVAIHKGGYLCEHKDGQYTLWKDAKPLPAEPEPIPFTHETWPKQVVWLRGTTKDNQGLLVTRTAQWGVSILTYDLTWNELFRLREMSLDFCQTWQPCHYAPEVVGGQ